MIKNDFYFNRLAPSANNLYSNAGRKRVKSKAYRKWRSDVSYVVSNPGVMQIDRPCACEILLIKPSKRKMDLVNREKGMIDVLVHDGWLLDDSLIHALMMRWVPAIAYPYASISGHAASALIPVAAVQLRVFEA